MKKFNIEFPDVNILFVKFLQIIVFYLLLNKTDLKK